MNKEQTRELLSDYINFHQQNESITNDEYRKLKHSAEQYTTGVIEPHKCVKCKGYSFDTEFKPEETKVYWSEHNEIKNIEKFTRNDRYYSADRIDKECIIKTCKTCGFKEAIKTND